MFRKERFGKLVLLEEAEQSLLGTGYRAAKLGPAGLEKIVALLRLRPAISANTEAARRVMDQVKLVAQLQSPNIVKIFGIGKVEGSYYVTYEFLEGRSLQQILDRCREESYPFAVDHALLIASKVCAVLEYAHGRRSESGSRLFHGLLTPHCVLVSFEGEVRLRGFGYWPSRLMEAGLLVEAEQRYLAPEQASGAGEDTRCDVFGLGAILFETLTGQPPPQGIDPAVLVGSARLLSPTGDDDSVPKPLADILQRALAPDPGARYAEIADLRKAIDTLLFSGDFTPTTFNLAFFMHSLFRDDMEREAKALKQEREASYAEYVAEEAARAAPSTQAVAVSGMTMPLDPRLVAAVRQEAAVLEQKPATDTLVFAPEPPAAPVPGPAPAASHPPHGSSPGLAAAAREASSSRAFHKEGRARSRMSVFLAAGVVFVLAAGAGAFYLFRGGTHGAPAASAPPPTTLSPEVIAAEQRVKELEEKLAALEAEKQAAEAKAADEARQKVEAQAKAKGQEVDRAALERAQEEARQKARQDEERRQREELRRVEEEKRAEEVRLAEERRRAEEAERAAQEKAAAEAALLAQATPTPTPPPTTAPPPPAPPPTTLAAVRPGTLVSLSDAGVIAPVLEKKPPLAYPPIALRQRAEGTVDLSLLVDEKGNVTDVQVLGGSGGRAGLTEAAADYAHKWKYRPATKDGVPVKVWTPVKVIFRLPQQ